MNKKVIVAVIGLVVVGLVAILVSTGLLPSKVVLIPQSIPRDLWGDYWGLLAGGGGVNVGGQVETGTMAWLPGWERQKWLDTEAKTVTWKWVKDSKTEFEYTLHENQCVMIGWSGVKLTMESKDPYWKYDVSPCGQVITVFAPQH